MRECRSVVCRVIHQPRWTALMVTGVLSVPASYGTVAESADSVQHPRLPMRGREHQDIDDDHIATVTGETLT